MGAERRAAIVRWTVRVELLLVVLTIVLPYLATHSTLCLDSFSDRGGGCIEEYRIEAFGVTVGAWFGIVEAAIIVGALLFLLIGAGWVFQRYMEKRERG